LTPFHHPSPVFSTVDPKTKTLTSQQNEEHADRFILFSVFVIVTGPIFAFVESKHGDITEISVEQLAVIGGDQRLFAVALEFDTFVD
jgi:hypothetical protein